MTLNNWYLKFFKAPLGVLLTIMLLVQLAFLYHSAIKREKETEDGIRKVSMAGFLGVKEKHRTTIELVLSSVISGFKAETAALCKGSEKILIVGDIYNSCQTLDNKNRFLYKTIKISVPGMLDYYFIFSIQRFFIIKDLFTLFLFSLFLSLLVFVFSLFVKKKVENNIIYPLINVISGKNSARDDTIIHEINQILEHEKEKKEIEKQKLISLALMKQSCQVAHDIRSPLAALDMVVRDLSRVPEQQRTLIRHSVTRIHDIANNLLRKSKKTVPLELGEKNDSADSVQNVYLTSVLETIITEKRMQYRDKKNIDIELLFSDSSYNLFANINTVEFQRVISNLVNNAMDAFDYSCALKQDNNKITVKLEENNKSIFILIQDNGKGIPADLLKSLGVEGETHGKKDGNGLGLYHAKTSMEKWGGGLNIESREREGTLIRLILPKTEAPSWFVTRITFKDKSNIVVVDDDPSIHAIWDKKFECMLTAEQDVNIIHIYSPDQLISWLKRNPDKKNKCTFLLDYEFADSSLTGLDLVKMLQIHNNTYLITSRFEEKQIQKRCVKNSVLALVPKTIAPAIPLELVDVTHDCVKNNVKNNDVETKQSNNQMSHHVLIDDDVLIQTTWEAVAQKNQIPFSYFTSGGDFIIQSNKFNPDKTFLYIDSNLGNGVKGEEIANEFFDMGYKNIYLCTGYEKEHFDELPWIKEIIGKNPPWMS